MPVPIPDALMAGVLAGAAALMTLLISRRISTEVQQPTPSGNPLPVPSK